ncbi:M48 family metallopeptidase [Thalassotalea aquiviva]|uniref:M48 family metallopeptidase n=1 Tax=Thalassotalea aquiviva TaxID=3242415 RepID=UPI00352B974A
MLDYTLVRSNRRRTISLQVKQAKLRVLAPSYVAESEIQQLVRQKQDWIKQKIAQQNTLLATSKTRQFTQGDVFFYLGQPLTLDIQQGINNRVQQRPTTLVVELSNTFFHHPKRAIHIKALLEQWYIQQAKTILSEQTLKMQALTKLNPSSLTIRLYKSRWGSCDNHQRVKLNWLLVMAPMEVIHYVIIHELCHLKHLNHSSAFWQLVETFYQPIKPAKDWLKKHQGDLVW